MTPARTSPRASTVARAPDTRPRDRANAYDISVAAPFRLDLTVSVLRRLSTNIVDLFTTDGEYVRVLHGSHGIVVARIMQQSPDGLVARFEGGGARDHVRALAQVRRILGVERELSHFNRVAHGLPWLRDLAARMRGVKPPRHPTLWEACVNAILFQQVSLAAASSISRRLILALEPPVDYDSITLHAFPSVDRFQGARADVLRAAGISANKLATLRRVADALQAGSLDEATMETLPSPEAVATLRGIKGIGPWTAAVILLRGLGRLDVFPMNDTSVTANLAFIGGPTRHEIDRVLAALGPQRGMLYYHLLLARLEARGDVGRASTLAA